MRKIKVEDLDDSNGIPLEETNNEDLELFHTIIKEKFNSQSPEEKFRNILISIRFKMEEYLETNNPSKLINVGYFIQEILDSLNIKSKNFAEYLNLKPSNFTSLIKGHRKLNVELALKLGAIFKEIPPQIWVNLQIKNELLKLKKEKSHEFKNYSLKALLKTN